MVKTLVTVVAFVSTMFQTVKELIVAFEQPGNGEAKRRAVIHTVIALVDAVPDSAVPAWLKQALSSENFLGNLIDGYVAVKNIIGEFTHRDSAADPTPALVG